MKRLQIFLQAFSPIFLVAGGGGEGLLGLPVMVLFYITLYCYISLPFTDFMIIDECIFTCTPTCSLRRCVKRKTTNSYRLYVAVKRTEKHRPLRFLVNISTSFMRE